ncbi:MAG: hypothetical protein M1826_006475 [Phylliscum demangeonii]|nr:MAG: hypothetical protein M1826_006475 [Phylliscum demangeonii]
MQFATSPVWLLALTFPAVVSTAPPPSSDAVEPFVPPYDLGNPMEYIVVYPERKNLEYSRLYAECMAKYSVGMLHGSYSFRGECTRFSMRNVHETRRAGAGAGAANKDCMFLWPVYWRGCALDHTHTIRDRARAHSFAQFWDPVSKCISDRSSKECPVSMFPRIPRAAVHQCMREHGHLLPASVTKSAQAPSTPQLAPAPAPESANANANANANGARPEGKEHASENGHMAFAHFLSRAHRFAAPLVRAGAGAENWLLEHPLRSAAAGGARPKLLPVLEY